MTKEIFIIAGDFSGDIHAAFLVQNILNSDKAIKISAIGGELLQKQNVNFLANIVSRQSFGFNGLLRKYFYFKKLLFQMIKPYFLKNKISAVILVDFYGFNIHVAKLAKSLGIKTVYYVCPQVWASRKNRIEKIKKYVDLAIPILPFESEIYESQKINVFYAGNPLIEIIHNEMALEKDFKINESKNEVLIGLMPGSRISEIKNILPIFLEIIRRLSKKNNKLKFFLIISKNLDKNLIENLLKIFEFRELLEIINGPAYKLRQKMRFILTSSGTSSFENLLLNTPMFIFYRMQKFSYFVAKLVVKIKFIGMPNILANRLIMPEYIQNFDYEKLTREINLWIEDDKIIEEKKNWNYQKSKKILVHKE